MKNKLSDLNDHLFAQLEKLCDDDVQGDNLKQEIERSKAVISISQTIINNSRLVLDAHVAAAEWNISSKMPMIGYEGKE